MRAQVGHPRLLPDGLSALPHFQKLPERLAGKTHGHPSGSIARRRSSSSATVSVKGTACAEGFVLRVFRFSAGMIQRPCLKSKSVHSALTVSVIRPPVDRISRITSSYRVPSSPFTMSRNSSSV